MELFELDSPAPPGDDVTIPEPYHSQNVHGNVIDTVDVSYRPNPDQSLGREVTDQTGYVRFGAVANTSGGVRRYEHKTEDRDTEVGKSTVDETPVPEPDADFGIAVTASDGRLLATRRLILANFPEKRVGTREHPFVVELANLPSG